jgi:hypothetical protein
MKVVLPVLYFGNTLSMLYSGLWVGVRWEYSGKMCRPKKQKPPAKQEAKLTLTAYEKFLVTILNAS